MLKIIVLSLSLAAAPAFADLFVINDTGDDPDANPGDGVCDTPLGGSPKCSLRAAIEEANSLAGSDEIEFEVGDFTLNLATPLPTITEGLIIDATTLSDYNELATKVFDATPLVRINGSGLGGTSADGLSISGDFVEVRGLAIFGFPDNGIEVNNAERIVLDANWIGIRHDGTAGGNSGSGIYLNACNQCIVGQNIPTGSDPNIEGIGNIVSNSGEDGIYVVLGDDNILGGNYIGIDLDNIGIFGNARHGIHLAGPNNQIGQFLELSADDFLATPNYSYYNGIDGIRVMAGSQRIYTNVIGQNGAAGISLNGSSTVVGDVNPEARNQIFGSGAHGIHIGNVLNANDSNILQYNWISGNTRRGVHLSAGSGNTIRGNEIHSNNSDAILLDDEGNLVELNDIGFFKGSVMGNAASGLVVFADANTLYRNRIGGMSGNGIDIIGGVNTSIVENLVGAADDGTVFGNVGDGIRVRPAAIGTQITENIIGDNSDGILLEAASNVVCGNSIGQALDKDIGNAVEGMRVLSGPNTIGDESSGCNGNLIGFNASDGIQVHGDNNTIRDNTIGGGPLVDVGNGRGGLVLTDGASLNNVANNVIWNNNDGIRVTGTAGTANRLEANNFGSNADLAIDLNDDGATANDAGDVDAGPNNLQNFPVITNIDDSGYNLVVSYHVDSGTGDAAYPLQVDFYFNRTHSRDGYRIASDTYDRAPGTTRIFTMSAPFGGGELVPMTIDADGNSSELGVNQSFFIDPPVDDLFKDRFEGP